MDFVRLSSVQNQREDTNGNNNGKRSHFLGSGYFNKLNAQFPAYPETKFNTKR